MIRHASARWRTALLVCAKCEKKLKNKGFGKDGRKPLSKVLRKAAGGKGRKAGMGVVSSRCLSICPRDAVTVINAANPRDWLVVPPGTPIEEVEAALGLSEKSDQPA